MDENQMHMVLYFAGFILGKYGTVIWTIQWFMLYHNMIKNKAAIQKAKWARNTVLHIVGIVIVLLLAMAVMPR